MQSPDATQLHLVERVSRSGGQPLDPATRRFFEGRLGHDFANVRVHADESAERTARAFDAKALTFGQHIAFGHSRYQPGRPDGRRLLAHELVHVVQQGGSEPLGAAPATATDVQPTIQRTLGDGHDLTSPRFALLLDLEAAFDDETVLETGSRGRGVQAVQQALYDLGFALPTSGADGDFGAETRAAVIAFQTSHPPLLVDGRVGKNTIAALDTRFGVPVLPPAANLSAPWTPACARSVLCQWSPHTVDVLRTRITLKSFDSISWADEEWDGASWVPAPFPGGGYHEGTEIGLLNGSCEDVAQTLYHEVLHDQQPTSQTTTRATESYAYRIGEEMSIGLGLAGRPALRSTDAQGREFADPGKVSSMVAAEYPGVSSAAPGDQIIEKAAAPGKVRVQRPDGSVYVRPAAVGEKVPGPINLVNERTHPPAVWAACP